MKFLLISCGFRGSKKSLMALSYIDVIDFYLSGVVNYDALKKTEIGSVYKLSGQ